MPITRTEKVKIGGDAVMDMRVEWIDGEPYDTEIVIYGTFWVGGAVREDFAKRLAALIAEYTI